MTRFALTIEYDGRPYMGWQRQSHGPSVQQALEEAVTRITGEEAAVHGAGRTDAGVHALAMRAHVDIAKSIAPFRLMEALNAQLRPAPVAVLACETVADDWHARFSCLGRSEEHTSELQSLMRISYAVFCLKNKKYIQSHYEAVV